MGNYICCCCPESDPVSGTDPNSASDFQGSTSETTPLLRNRRRLSSQMAHSPVNAGGFGAVSQSPMTTPGAHADVAQIVAYSPQPVNQEQQLLNQIITDSANQIVDYTSSTLQPGRNVGAANSRADVPDVTEVRSRSNLYSKKLTGVAGGLVNKHFKESNPRPAMQEPKESTEGAINTGAEDLLSESNGTLVSEVSERAEDEAAIKVPVPENLIVRFGDDVM